MPRSSLDNLHRIKTGLLARPGRLLILAACLHLATTVSVFTIGRLSLMPNQFDRDGIGEFAADGHAHLADSIQLTEILANQGVTAWLTATAPLHCRVYSLPLAVLHKFVGFNIVTIEPVNLALYLVTLWLVFQLAEILFDRASALLASIIVALWPTLLIHTTQPLRDPLLIVLVMVLFVIVESWLRTRLSWPRALVIGGVGVLILLSIWIVRLAMWDISRVVVALGLVILVLKQVKERRLMIPNVVAGAMLVTALVVIPHYNKQLMFLEKRAVDSNRLLIGEEAARLPFWDRVIARRNGFIDRSYDEDYQAGSDVDANVRFHNKTELMLYLPRAAAIGLFAPFPNAWFAHGLLVGRTGRLISGAEMIVTYILEAFAVFGLWRKRRDSFAWLISATAFLGVTALGLIVINIGSLYRLRYPYWILVVILGCGGAFWLLSKVRDRQTDIPQQTAVS